jgi:hypothetical protein
MWRVGFDLDEAGLGEGALELDQRAALAHAPLLAEVDAEAAEGGEL